MRLPRVTAGRQRLKNAVLCSAHTLGKNERSENIELLRRGPREKKNALRNGGGVMLYVLATDKARRTAVGRGELAFC